MPTATTDDMTDDVIAERCSAHDCCIRAPEVDVEPGYDRLRGEWHLQWMSADSAWFLAPPRGNVFEIRVAPDDDPLAALEVEGVRLDAVRRASERDDLFPPC
jgi:hypothetical protein